MSDLEKKFKTAQNKANKEIDKQMTIALEAVQKACEISEQYGVPFYASVSPLGQSYKPDSFFEKWGELDNVEELLDEGYVSEYEGWEHSAVC